MNDLPESFMMTRSFLLRIARHTLGILLLLITVILFTTSNFLASTIFADNSYSKPFFVTYVNNSIFLSFLLLYGLKRLIVTDDFARNSYQDEGQHRRLLPLNGNEYEITSELDSNDATETPTLVLGNSKPIDDDLAHSPEGLSCDQVEESDILGVRETIRLSLEFGFLWFIANYFTAACLSYTSVASATILTATSSVWTLIIGAFVKVEVFTIKKATGVLASFIGTILTSGVDIFGDINQHRGLFPHKSQQQVVIGDALAFASAVLYGLYTSLMKRRVRDETRLSMLLFLGFVGLFNMIALMPGFLILHYTGIESFELPPTPRVLTIVLVNAVISVISDVCWAYAILLTSPLVVTVGLSLTIPLSLIGQIVLNAQIPSPIYWVGAGIVFLSFVFVNHESKKQEQIASKSKTKVVDTCIQENS